MLPVSTPQSHPATYPQHRYHTEPRGQWPDSCGPMVCQQESCRDPSTGSGVRDPETHLLGPNPKNSFTDPITGAQTHGHTPAGLHSLVVRCGHTHAHGASRTHAGAAIHNATKLSQTACGWSHTDGHVVAEQAQGHAQSNGPILTGVPCVQLAWYDCMAHTHSWWGHEGGNKGDEEMRCGDTGREVAGLGTASVVVPPRRTA